MNETTFQKLLTGAKVIEIDGVRIFNPTFLSYSEINSDNETDPVLGIDFTTENDEQDDLTIAVQDINTLDESNSEFEIENYYTRYPVTLKIW